MGVLDLLFWFVFVVYFSAHIYCADDVRVCDRDCVAPNPPIPLNILNNMHHLRFVLASTHSNVIHGMMCLQWISSLTGVCFVYNVVMRNL